MDRDETIRISKLAHFGGLSEADINSVLMNYCLEHNKPQYETALFITKILTSPNLVSYYLGIALRYYERKYLVYKLWSKPETNPLNNQGRRKLLQIF